MKQLIDKLRSVKGIGLLVIGLAAGVMLLILGNHSESEESEVSTVSDEFSFEAYENSLSERLCEMIGKVEGVSNVHVMLTLERGYSDDLAKDGEEYLTVKHSDGAEGTVRLSREAPEVKGVAVICKGGENPEIQQQIIKMTAALFNLPTSRIFVSGG